MLESKAGQERQQSSSKPPWRLETANLAKTIVFSIKYADFGTLRGSRQNELGPGNALKTGREQPPQHQSARPKLVRDLAKLQQAPLKTSESESWESKAGQEWQQSSS